MRERGSSSGPLVEIGGGGGGGGLGGQLSGVADLDMLYDSVVYTR